MLSAAVPTTRGKAPAWQQVTRRGCAHFTIVAATAAAGGGGKEPAWIYQQLELSSFRQDRKARRKRLALTLVGIRWDDCEYLFLAKVELLFFSSAALIFRPNIFSK